MPVNEHRVREIVQSPFGRDTRQPIARSCEHRVEVDTKRIDKIEVFHDERVRLASLEAIPQKTGYYTLVFTRANNK